MALFQSENELFESKKELLDAKMWYNFEFLGCGITPLPFKNFMHPSCQVLGAAPVQHVSILLSIFYNFTFTRKLVVTQFF